MIQVIVVVVILYLFSHISNCEIRISFVHCATRTILQRYDQNFCNGMSKKVGLEDEILRGSFNNYVDKMRGGGGQKCLFLSTPRV